MSMQTCFYKQKILGGHTRNYSAFNARRDKNGKGALLLILFLCYWDLQGVFFFFLHTSNNGNPQLFQKWKKCKNKKHTKIISTKSSTYVFICTISSNKVIWYSLPPFPPNTKIKHKTLNNTRKTKDFFDQNM